MSNMPLMPRTSTVDSRAGSPVLEPQRPEGDVPGLAGLEPFGVQRTSSELESVLGRLPALPTSVSRSASPRQASPVLQARTAAPVRPAAVTPAAPVAVEASAESPLYEIDLDDAGETAPLIADPIEGMQQATRSGSFDLEAQQSVRSRGTIDRLRQGWIDTAEALRHVPEGVLVRAAVDTVVTVGGASAGGSIAYGGTEMIGKLGIPALQAFWRGDGGLMAGVEGAYATLGGALVGSVGAAGGLGALAYGGERLMTGLRNARAPGTGDEIGEPGPMPGTYPVSPDASDASDTQERSSTETLVDREHRPDRV